MRFFWKKSNSYLFFFLITLSRGLSVLLNYFGFFFYPFSIFYFVDFHSDLYSFLSLPHYGFHLLFLSNLLDVTWGLWLRVFLLLKWVFNIISLSNCLSLILIFCFHFLTSFFCFQFGLFCFLFYSFQIFGDLLNILY